MPNQKQTTVDKADKKHKPERLQTLTTEPGLIAELPATSTLPPHQDNIQAQAAALSDERIPLLQRQMMAGQMEYAHGNLHLQRVLATANQDNHQGIQARLAVNEPGDPYEQEADRVADAVIHMPAAAPADEDDQSVRLQPTISRLQTGDEGNIEVSPDVESRVEQMQSGGSPLPEEEQGFFEERMGADFSDVRIHTDDQAAQTAQDLNARAYTVGSDIAFNQGEYQPGSEEGRHLLAHELTHTIQQGAAQRLQRAPVEEEGICPVCGRRGKGTCSGCGQPFQPIQRQLDESLESQLAAEEAEPLTEAEGQETATGTEEAADQNAAAPEAETTPETPETRLPETGAETPAAESSPVETQAETGPAMPAGLPEPAETAAPAGQGAAFSQNGAGAPGANGAGLATEGGLSGATQANLGDLLISGQAPDSTDQILGLAEQVKTGGLDPESMSPAIETPDFSNILRDCGKIPEATEEETATVDLTPLIEQVQLERERLLQAASNGRQLIMADAQAEQAALLAAIEAETTRLEEIYAQTIEQVYTTTASARGQIETQRQQQINAVDMAAETQLVNLPLLIEQKKTEIRQLAEAKATAAEAFGASEAQRAIDGCRTKADAARQLGEDKAAQYSHYEEAADIAQAARQMAAEVAGNITSAGQDMAQTARDDMAKLAAKFRQDAEDAAAGFDSLWPDAQAKINQERQEATETINQVAGTAISELETSSADIVGQLQANRGEAIARLSEVGQTALPAIEELAQAAGERIDQDTAVAIAQLEAFVYNEVIPQYSQASGPEAKENLATIQAGISAAVAQFEADMELFATAEMPEKFQRHALGVQDEVTAYVDGLATQLEETSLTFSDKAVEIADQVTGEMESAGTKSVQKIEQIGQDVESKIETTISEYEGRWDQELTDGQNDVKQKIDEGLAEQDRALVELARAIDEKAEEIENSSWLDAIGDFFSGLGDFLGGLLEGISSVLAGIVEAIFDFVGGLIQGLIDLVVSVLEFLWEAFLAILEFLWGVITWLVGAIIWLLGQIADLLLSLVVWIASWFGGWKWLEELLGSLREFIARLGSLLADPFTGDLAGCDDAQAAKLERASTQAVLLGNSALGSLSVSPLAPATEAAFNRFFKSTAPEHIAQARSVLGAAVAGLQGDPADLKCEPSGSAQCSGVHAYTFWKSIMPGVSIHFCADTVDSMDERALALIVLHEATHKYGSTDDHAYGAGALSLDTDDALDNADSYEQFTGAVA